MIEVLEFIFRSFWTWLGSFMMLGLMVTLTANIANIIMKLIRRK